MLLSRIPSIGQIMQWLGLAETTEHRAIVCSVIALIVLLSPVIVGLLLHLLLCLQMKLLSRFSPQFAVAFANYVTFPGTIFHESAHLLLAVVTGAQVVEVKFLEHTEDTLGHVTYRNRGFFLWCRLQDTLISCAPTVLGVVGCGFLLEFILRGGYVWWQYILLWYLFVSLLDHATMSPADLKNYFGGVWVFLLPVFACLMWL